MQALLPRISPLVSGLVIVTYLATALLVCDPDRVSLIRDAATAIAPASPAAHQHGAPESPAVAAHHAHQAPVAPSTPSTPRTPTAHGSRHADGGQHPEKARGHDHDHHLDRDHGDGHGRADRVAHAAGSETGVHAPYGHARTAETSRTQEGPTSPSFSDLRAGGLEFAATCLCGCSETRSTVGGNTSRLGSVVPGLVVARLPEPGPLSFETPYPGRFTHRSDESDPIPI